MENKHLNIAVIGASGSLGEQLVKQLAKKEVNSVFAFSRSKTEFNNSKIKSYLIDIAHAFKNVFFSNVCKDLIFWRRCFLQFEQFHLVNSRCN